MFFDVICCPAKTLLRKCPQGKRILQQKLKSFFFFLIIVARFRELTSGTNKYIYFYTLQSKCQYKTLRITGDS